jgi:hypothetical protein
MAFLPEWKRRMPNVGNKGRLVETLYSYLDLPATILDLYGVRTIHYYGRSFAHELGSGNSYEVKKRRCMISVQPFSGGAIVVIKFPKKYIFDLKSDRVTVYDLAVDPNEINPVETIVVDAQRLSDLKSCLTDLATRGGNPR